MDQLVLRLKERDKTEISPVTKRSLSALVTADVVHTGQMSPLFQDMAQFARSVWDVIDGKKAVLKTAGLLSDIEVEGMANLC